LVRFVPALVLGVWLSYVTGWSTGVFRAPLHAVCVETSGQWCVISRKLNGRSHELIKRLLPVAVAVFLLCVFFSGGLPCLTLKRLAMIWNWLADFREDIPAADFC